MTRDEAFTIIADALGPIPQQTDTASHIATALDALGLLCMATAPGGERSDAHEIASKVTVDRMTEEELLKGLEIAAAARIVSGDLLGNEVQDHSAWATKRQRT